MRAGQKLVCIASGKWSAMEKLSYLKRLWYGSNDARRGPVFNEIVTVESVRGECYILVEYPEVWKGNRQKFAYHKSNFEPLVSDAKLALELAEIFTENTK